MEGEEETGGKNKEKRKGIMEEMQGGMNRERWREGLHNTKHVWKKKRKQEGKIKEKNNHRGKV